MELYCVFPIVGQIMMRSATFDDTGGIKTQGFPGTMEVNMVFSDEANEDTGETDWCKLCIILCIISLLIPSEDLTSLSVFIHCSQQERKV